MPVLLIWEYQDAVFEDERVIPVYLGGRADLAVELLLRSFGSLFSVVSLIPCIVFAYLSVAFLMLLYCSPYWGLTPRSLWGWYLLPVCFSGFPGFSAGRGFDPAGGAPGGG
ncbi:hypothetical protein F511_33497 [Dorcoceras hygrometricum]|uniref:Uncharacterized protein n=1 Tax=Dorcoceras hygrometricum TaxID=472368 RepID=A0A2Z7BQY9_9LAMI|nr:hypothetical protein F511_33497 [Dorcoceras hygrometricum]